VAAFFAFLHHAAAFTLVAALAVEFVLIRDELTLKNARKLQVADLIFGGAAVVVLVAGLLRVFFFEKGASYYFHSVPFIAKLSLYVIVAALSIYPTLQFVSWGKAVRQRKVPAVTDRRMRRLRAVIHWELAGVVVLILCAALTAKGVGSFG